MMDSEDRIVQLERQASRSKRNFRWLLFSVGAFMAVAPLVAKSTPKEIRARAFTLVDRSGVSRAELRMIELPDGEVAPGFALLNENGEPLLVLGAQRTGAVITLSDNPDNARVILYGGVEVGSLALYDEAGEAAWYADSGSSQGVVSGPEDRGAGLKQGQEEIATAGPRPPSDDAARPTIRSKCAEEWGDDFKMQKYCQDQQFEALADLRARSMADGPYATIRKNCSEEWAPDYQMRDYCEKQQLEALRELNR